MSRHLFITCVAASDVLDALEHSHAQGTPLSPILTDLAWSSRIAYFAIVFDGWSHTAEDLERLATPTWRPILCRIAGNSYGCTRLSAAELRDCRGDPLANSHRFSHILNNYAIRTFSIALETCAGFADSTGLNAIIIHASLGGTYCDSDFRSPQTPQ